MDNCTLTFAKANGQNPPKYYDTGEAVRCYKNNTLKVEVLLVSRVNQATQRLFSAEFSC